MTDPIIDNQTLPVNTEFVESEQIDFSAGMNHSFDIGHAKEYGVNEAIMIHNLKFFISMNANRGHNFHEGRYWTYDKLEDFPKHFPYWSVDQCKRIIKSLIVQGVIIKGDFNKSWSNRTCWYAFRNQSLFIKLVNPPKQMPISEVSQGETGDKEKIADLANSPNEIWRNRQMTSGEFAKCTYSTTTIPTSIPSPTSLKVPTEPPPIVGSVGVFSSPKPKAKKEAPEFSPKVREVGTKMLNLLTEHHPVYRPPEDLTKFLNQVRMMLEDDKQKVEDILETFAWAAADNIKRDTFNGWQSVICRNKKKGRVSNPAEIFREHFASINSQMKSKKPRKFAEYSDDKVLAQQAIEMAEGFI